MRRLLALLLWLYRQMLALYPTSYRDHFAAEMEEVFWQKMRNGSNKQALIFLREVRDLPVGLLGAYGRQRKLALASMAQYTPVEYLALRLRPLVWGMVAVLVVAALLYTFWIGMWADQLYYPQMPVLQGSSALILEDDGEFARLPQTMYSCEAFAEKNQAKCTAEIGGKELELTLWLSLGNNSFTGGCSGRYGWQPVDCMQLFVRAKEHSMPPVSVDRPRAMTDAQWRELRANYAFTFPSADWWFDWGVAISGLVSLVVAAVIWIASRATTGRVEGSKIVGRLIGAMVAAVVCFVPMAWLMLLFSLQLDEWFERF